MSPVNGAQFARQIVAEAKAIGKEFVDWRADLVADILTVAERRSPTGPARVIHRRGKTISLPGRRLLEGWGANIGSKPRYQTWSGSGSARTHLRRARPGSTIVFGNREFYSSWQEKGTRTTTRARWMLRTGIESVKDRKG